jgi:hypothetical protein
MGHYTIGTRWRRQETIQFMAPGYAIESKSLNAEGSRYPVVDAALIRTRAVPGAPPGARFDPYTGEPLKYQAPRFDPYTGKPVEESAP